MKKKAKTMPLFQRNTKALVAVEEKPPLDNVKLIREWLHGRPATTIAAYTSDIARLVTFTNGLPLNEITLSDLQAFADSLADLAPASQARILKACKSLLTFGCKTMPSAFPANAGAALKIPKFKRRLAERLLSEEELMRVFLAEPDPRNRLILRLLYNSTMRRSELVGLCWRDCQPRPDKHSGQLTIFGKGSKTRTVLLKPEVWRELWAWRKDAPDDAPVFDLSTSRIYQIVREAGDLSGIGKRVSPHWMRHAHASHAIKRGAPLPLVRDTGGWASVDSLDPYLHAQPDQSSGDFLP